MVAIAPTTPHRTPLQATLGHYCANRHVGREKLAAAAHVDGKTVARWVAGEASPRMENLEHLCRDSKLPEPVRWAVAVAAHLTLKPTGSNRSLLDLNGDGVVDAMDLAAQSGRRVLAAAVANQHTMQAIANDRLGVEELGRAIAEHGEMIAESLAELEIKQLLADRPQRRACH